MISTTGRRPDCAAPTAIPQIAASLIGVFRTRSGPNCSARPFVAPHGPPSATSSPRTNTRWSARIAVASASVIAPRYVVSGIDEGGRRCRRGERARTRDLDRLLQLRPRLFLEAAVSKSPLQPQDRIELLPLLGLERLPVELRVAFVVPAEAVGEALEQERSVAGTRVREEAPERLVDGKYVVAVHGFTP